MFRAIGISVCRLIMPVMLALSPVYVCAQSAESIKYAEQMERFFNVYQIIQNRYFIHVPAERLFNKAIQGMMDILDPHSQFQVIKHENPLNLGIKWHHDPDINRFVVSHVDEKSGAKAAGVQTGDVLMEINKIPLGECSLNEDSVRLYDEKMKDILYDEVKKGKVRITFARKVLGADGAFNLKNKNIDVNIVNYAKTTVPFGCLIDGKVAYIRVKEFDFTGDDAGTTTYSEFYNKLRTLRYQYNNLKAAADSGRNEDAVPDTLMPIIIDIRGNGGGLVKAAIDIAGMFLDERSMVCYVEGEHHNETMITEGKPEYRANPLVFLVDKATASASELLSGAMQDQMRGIVIGQRTYGKGIMQITMENGEFQDNKLSITIGRYFLPSGRCVQRWDYSPLVYGEEKREIYNKDDYGITPDSMVNDTTPAFFEMLAQQNAFFNSCVDLRIRYPEVMETDARTFELTEEQLEYFKVRLLENGYIFETQVWKDFSQMKESLSQYGVDTNYRQLEEDVLNQLSKKLEGNDEILRVMVTKKLMDMYRTAEDYYLYSLNHDYVLDVAMKVLNGGLYEDLMDKKPER